MFVIFILIIFHSSRNNRSYFGRSHEESKVRSGYKEDSSSQRSKNRDNHEKLHMETETKIPAKLTKEE